MSEIDNVINVASEEVGYLEKSWAAYNENPDVIYNKTEGAGRDNVTKYAKEMDDLGVYNGPKQGYAWCKVFVDWVLTTALGLDRAGQLLYGWTASVTQAYNWFRDNGQISNTPEIGDLIIFGDCDHIGIVVDYDDSRVYTIEGNTSGATGLVANGGGVAQKSYSRWSSYIKCYARPEYEGEPGPGPTPPEPPTPSGDQQIADIQQWLRDAYGLDVNVDGYYGPQTKMYLTMAYQMELNANYGANLAVDGIFGSATKSATPILSVGDEGDLVGIVQSILYCRGYNPMGVDNIYGSGTRNAIRTFQANRGLSVDGVYGPETGYRLFN